MAIAALAGSAGAITGNYTDDFIHDNVGVVVLDQPVTPANGFGMLPQPGQIDTYAAGAKKDARFIVSGYGLSDQDPVPVSFRKRLMAESYLVNNESPVTEFNLKTTANASQGRAGPVTGTPEDRCSSRART